jgi:hypothetical protein
MRPLGHTTMRDERESIVLTDALRDPWRTYLKHVEFRSFPDTYLQYALEALDPIRPDIATLHAHATIAHIHAIRDSRQLDDFGRKLGAFITAGYILSPDEIIACPLNIPSLSYLGVSCAKTIIVEGTVGSKAGYMMIGTLVNNGTLGYDAGERLIGTFINNGVIGKNPAHRMIGVYTNTTCAAKASGFSLGDNNGRWGVWQGQREAFLHDLTNPGGLGHDPLSRLLHRRYRRWRK